MSKFPMTPDEEDDQSERARALHELDDADGIRCRRCHSDGLYWQKVTQADGMRESSVLFDSHTRRRHVCSEPDVSAFSGALE